MNILQNNKNRMLMGLLAMVLLGTGCQSEAEQQHHHEPTRGREHYIPRLYSLGPDQVALQGYSPVAYWERGKAIKGSPDYAVRHNGVTYYLDGQQEVKMFESDPARFVPAYGGWCAYGMAVGERIPANPERFKVVEGRVMLFMSTDEVDTLTLWNCENQRVYVAKADNQWRRMNE